MKNCPKSKFVYVPENFGTGWSFIKIKDEIAFKENYLKKLKNKAV